MATPRSFLNLTMLPDGNVLCTGGGTDRTGFDTNHAVLSAEMWSPVTEAWTTRSSMQTPRLYHSTALLLPDARVLVAGGGGDLDVVDQLSGEVFSPPYLFKGPRPTITATPSTLSYGSNFLVTTPDASIISSVSLIGLGSVTHSFNQNQRFLNCDLQVAPGGINVRAPANSKLAPPGYYLLFLVSSKGVPSVGALVNLPVVLPSPHIDSFTAVGGRLVLRSTGPARASCTFLMATNCAQPLNTWTPVVTSAFDATGQLAFTNALDPAMLGKFYRLRMP